MERKSEIFEFIFLKRLLLFLPVGLLFFAFIKGFSFYSIFLFTLSFSALYLNYLFLGLFTYRWRMQVKYGQNNSKGVVLSYFLRYSLIIPIFYILIRVAKGDIFAIISGAVWATFAFIINTIILIKERSKWNTEEEQQSS